MVKIRPIMGFKFTYWNDTEQIFHVKIRPIMGLKFPIVFI